MPSRKYLALGILFMLATVLAAANVWFTAARSTIPLRLDGVVVRKEVRHEKHPPRDDVWLLDLGPQGVVQVDQSVFDQVAVGHQIRKEPWSRTLQCNQRRVDLNWSADYRGMLRAMPLSVTLLFAIAIWVGASAESNHSSRTGSFSPEIMQTD